MVFKSFAKSQCIRLALLSFILMGMASSPPLMGGPAPNFQLKTVDGQTMKMSDLKGKFVVLNFWATWCLACTKEMPEMQKAHQSGKNIKIIAINLAEPKEKVSDFIRNKGFSFSVLLDDYGNVSQQYEVINLPVTYFITPDGIVREKVFGGGLTQKMIEAKFNQFN